MIINKNIEILISYKIQNGDWQSIQINPQDYFDGDNHGVDEEEFEIDIDSLPLFDDAIDYINIDNKKDISCTKLSITDIDTKERLVIKVTYWNNQNNHFSERIDFNSNGSVDYREIIVTSLIQEDLDEMVWEIMRFPEIDDLFTPSFHSFITEDQERLISERVIHSTITPSVHYPAWDIFVSDRRSKLKPDPNATGSHSVIKINHDGKIKGYETFRINPRYITNFETELKYHSEGYAHYNKATKEKVETPHIHDKDLPNGIGKPNSDQIPK